jgi:hypothetical protein
VVLRLLRIGGHRNGLVANVFDLVDAAGLLERTARRVVADEFGAHDATRVCRRRGEMPFSAVHCRKVRTRKVRT